MMLYTKYESSGPCSFRQKNFEICEVSDWYQNTRPSYQNEFIVLRNKLSLHTVHLTVSFWQVKAQQAMNMKLIKYTGFQEIPGTRLSSTTHCLNVFTHQISMFHCAHTCTYR